MDERRLRYLLGKRIRGFRDAAKLSRVDFAATAGISVTFLADLEAGKKTPSAWTLWRIAQALEVSPGELLQVESETTLSRDAPTLGDKVDRLARDAPEDELKRFVELASWFFRPHKRGRRTK